jgi:oligoribonuclease NrnB/cAMP/cGMP phosphodiesterase (DHH superfamily)
MKVKLPIKTIVTHADCPDGTASAIFLHDALPSARVVFIRPGTDEHRALPAEEGMLFCDISPPEARADEFVMAGAFVLDHHKTARHVVERFGERGVFADEDVEPGVCGAVLAYREVWTPLRMFDYSDAFRAFANEFAMLAGVRDTWQKTHPSWEAACHQALGLVSVPAEEWLKKSFTRFGVEWDTHLALTRHHTPEVLTWREVGRLLAKNDAKRIVRVIQDAEHFISEQGTRVILFEGISATSDAAEMLGSEADLVLGFKYIVERGARKLAVSTRSHTTFDCAAFARAHGGGGHTRAAGFAITLMDPDSDPYTRIEKLLNAYEERRADERLGRGAP